MALVSIIMPVYNAMPYLKEAISSILGQSYKNIELICVNDGSTDNSLDILRALTKKDVRIEVIEQNNQGAGVARNNGLSIANGEYVIFLDSDDYFDSSLIEKMINCAEVNDADICICKAWAVNASGKIAELNFNNNFFTKYNNQSFSPIEVKNDILNSFLVEPWNKLYRREFLLKNKLKFQSLKKTNDLFFTSVSLIKAQKIALVNEKLIFYRLDNRKKRITVYEDKLLDHYKALLKTKEAIDTYDKDGCFLSSFFSLALKIIFYNLTLNLSEAVRKKLFHFYAKKGLKELGFLHFEVSNRLSKIEKIQLCLLKANALYTLQYLLYKLTKIVEYQKKNGLSATLLKIIH